jgi:hypothetical protein
MPLFDRTTGVTTNWPVVASYSAYDDAARAVDSLAGAALPVERVAIAARDLHVVERVTGRRTYGRAAVSSGLAGAAIGAMFGFLLGLLNLAEPLVASLWLAIYGALLGAAIGALVGAATRAIPSGARQFVSRRSFDADRYEIRAAPDVAARAAELLGRDRNARLFAHEVRA